MQTLAKASLLVHNTLTGRKESFDPLDPGKVKMYVCGVTPYDEAHLGHARCYVTFDFIRRSLKALGYEVRHVQNFTDIDDKIIQRARERGVSPADLAERYIQDYFEKMDKLHVQRAEAYPRVTQSIPLIIAFVERLVQKGLAYPVEGDVYYAVRGFPEYGKLSKRSLEDLKSGARVEVDERKRDPLDFALWKAAKPGEPAWDSPWGPGRPGWHIECSAMSMAGFGAETFDIHGGGQDLIFPHHENEIAQSEGATGRPFARYWIHNGFVTLNKEKMSKSLGNFFSLAQIFQKYEPRAVRMLLLSQHYRTPLEFSEDLMSSAAASLRNTEQALQRLQAVLRTPQAREGGEEELEAHIRKSEANFLASLADDFNSPQARAALFELLNFLETRVAAGQPLSASVLRRGLEFIRRGFQEVLGVPLSSSAATEESEVQSLVQRREEARRAKNWAEADRIREELESNNIAIEDTPQGPRWWRKG
jgi:cysteinyl-tRNA synthetase